MLRRTAFRPDGGFGQTRTIRRPDLSGARGGLLPSLATRSTGKIAQYSLDRIFIPRTRESQADGYIYLFGRDKTPHQVARDFGHDEVFEFLMRHSPQEVKLAACELGDEDLFRSLLASHPNLIETLSDNERRGLPNAAQSNNIDAVRLMLAAGWLVDARGEYDMTPLQ